MGQRPGNVCERRAAVRLSGWPMRNAAAPGLQQAVTSLDRDHRRSKCLHQCSTCRCPSTGTSRVRTTNRATPAATASTGCTTGSSRQTGSSAGRPGRPDNCGTNGTRPARCWRVGVPWSRSITGAVMHHGVPIFVPSHRPPGPSVANYPLVTYVTDGIASAMAQAKAAAGDRNVMVHGAYTAQRALEAGVLDELQIHQIPVLFGRWPSAVRGVAVARRAGDRSGDRHAGGHTHPLPRPSLSRSTSGLVRQRTPSPEPIRSPGPAFENVP